MERKTSSFTYIRTFNTYIIKHTRSINKNTQTCPNRSTMHLLFPEPVVYERGTKW